MSVSPSPNTADAFLHCRDLTKSFPTPRGDVTVLRSVELHVRRGEHLAIVGRSGSGKSTLLNMLAAIDTPTRGEVRVGGIALHELSERESALWRGRNVGIVFQFFQLLPGLSVIENVMLPMDFAGTFAGEREQRALELLERVGLGAHAHKRPTALSGGEQQRVAVARALANDPPLILADEPTGNLDSETSAAIDALLAGLARENKTVLVVTHGAVESVPYSRIVKLADGRIASDRPRSSAGLGGAEVTP